MDRVGISFLSTHSAEQVRTKYIDPLRVALRTAQAGVYTNYLHQDAASPDAPAEHLLIFEVNDFRAGLRLLRVQLALLDPPETVQFHNLNPSDLPY